MPRQRSGIGYTHKRGTGRNTISRKSSIDVCRSFRKGTVDCILTSCDGLSPTPNDDGTSLSVPSFVHEGAIMEQPLSSISSSGTKRVVHMEHSTDASSPTLQNARCNTVHTSAETQDNIQPPTFTSASSGSRAQVVNLSCNQDSVAQSKVMVIPGGLFIAGGTSSDIPLLQSVLQKSKDNLSSLPLENITISGNSKTSSLTDPSYTNSAPHSEQTQTLFLSSSDKPTPHQNDTDLPGITNSALPTPLNLSNAFASYPSTHSFTTVPSSDREASVSSQSASSKASSSAHYMSQYRATKRIRDCILSAGSSVEDQAKALQSALTHKDVSTHMQFVGPIVPKECAAAIYQYQQKQRMISCSQVVGNKKRPSDDRKTFVYNNIVTTLSSPSKKSKYDIDNIMRLTNRSRSTAYRWKTKLGAKRGKLLSERYNPKVKWSILPRTLRPKKVSDTLRALVVEWILKNSNVRQSPIVNDSLLIKNNETGQKERVPKLLLECSMRQLHNELLASPQDGGLAGARDVVTKEAVISDTMLRSIAPPQLRQMSDRHKLMCGCEYCTTSKYLQESLNAWRLSHIKRMQVKANATGRRRRSSHLQAYKQYTEFVYPNDTHRHPMCQNAADSVMCKPVGDISLPNWKCVLRQCPNCHHIDVPPLELDCSDTAPTIIFQTYMKQMRCAIHGVLTPHNIMSVHVRGQQYKKVCLPCENTFQEASTNGFQRGKLTIRKKLFKLERSIGEFHRSFYIPSIEKLAYHRSYYRILGKHHVAAVRHETFISRPGDISTRSD
jgi:hypothetical protein